MATRMERELRKLLEQKKKEAQQKQDEYDLMRGEAAMGVLTDYLKNDPEACRQLAGRTNDQLLAVSVIIASHLSDLVDEALAILSIGRNEKRE